MINHGLNFWEFRSAFTLLHFGFFLDRLIRIRLDGDIIVFLLLLIELALCRFLGSCPIGIRLLRDVLISTALGIGVRGYAEAGVVGALLVF